MSAAILLNLVHPDMKLSEKFDFVTDYFKRMAGGEFLRYFINVIRSLKQVHIFVRMGDYESKMNYFY